MAPNRIHLIRHAQGYHNLSIASHNIPDPLLTPEGKKQCRQLASKIKYIESIDCIVSSPSRRTLYTALIVFRTLLQAKPDLTILALPELQETSSLPCDVGLSPNELRSEFQNEPIDFSLVSEGWNNKESGPFAPRSDLIVRRARKARQFLRNRREKEVAVVTHGGLLHFLTGDWLGSTTGIGTGWANCELRTYMFKEPPLAETPASITERAPTQRPLTTDEQLELQLVTFRSWAKDGYIILANETDVTGEGNYADDDEIHDLAAPQAPYTPIPLERLKSKL